MDAHAIFSTIEEAIQNLGLDLNYLMGHCFEGAKVMSGHKKRRTIKIKKNRS
jgi:hypothetical protein